MLSFPGWLFLIAFAASTHPSRSNRSSILEQIVEPEFFLEFKPDYVILTNEIRTTETNDEILVSV